MQQNIKAQNKNKKIPGHHRKMNTEWRKAERRGGGHIDIKKADKNIKLGISKKKIRYPVKYKSSMLLYS
jgi:hypothetical protein